MMHSNSSVVKAITLTIPVLVLGLVLLLLTRYKAIGTILMYSGMASAVATASRRMN